MAEEKAIEKKPSKFKKFFKDLKSEFKKIVWPTWENTKRSSIVVIVCIIIAGVAIFLLDSAFGNLFSWLGGLIG